MKSIWLFILAAIGAHSAGDVWYGTQPALRQSLILFRSYQHR
jgi:hypothetical protein